MRDLELSTERSNPWPSVREVCTSTFVRGQGSGPMNKMMSTSLLVPSSPVPPVRKRRDGKEELGGVSEDEHRLF